MGNCALAQISSRRLPGERISELNVIEAAFMWLDPGAGPVPVDVDGVVKRFALMRIVERERQEVVAKRIAARYFFTLAG